MADGLIEAAPAKVNLFLHIIGRRPDGYHLLDSLVVFAGVGDVLEAERADELSLDVGGPFAGALASEDDNLVLRAARALAVHAGIGPCARLVLHKNLPVASGIGGGSADAAAALRVLSRLWGISTKPGELARLAVGLGADVPVCLDARGQRMSGVGEVLTPSPVLPNCGIVLVNPGVAMATADVFRARRGKWSSPAELPVSWPNVDAMVGDLAELRNDLEPAAVSLQPAIGEVLEALRAVSGCRLARMSGSGATCFGIFHNTLAAAAAVPQLQRRGWWCWGGGLRLA